jgi:hypothetical protein
MIVPGRHERAEIVVRIGLLHFDIFAVDIRRPDRDVDLALGDIEKQIGIVAAGGELRM